MPQDKNNFDTVLRMTDKDYSNFLRQSEAQKDALYALMKNPTNKGEK